MSRAYYERHLPHQVPPGYPIFLTWNLKGSLPQQVLHELEHERECLDKEPKRIGESTYERNVRHGKILFAKRDHALDADCQAYVSLSRLTREDVQHSQESVGLESAGEETVRLESLTYGGRPMWLADPEAARKVVDSILWGVPQRYDLFSYVVLGNHAHVLLTPHVDLAIITQGIKGYTSYQINRIQRARGRTLWQDESYDHWARDEEEFFRILEYIENNPVAAKLCRRPEEWRWSSAFWRDKLRWTFGEPFRPDWKEISRTSAFPD